MGSTPTVLEPSSRYELTPADRSRGGLAWSRQRHRAILERAERSDIIARIVDGAENDQLPNVFAGLAVQVALTIVSGEDLPECKTPEDVLKLASAADKLHKMARLAGGQSTSNAASINVDGTELAGLLRSRLAQLSKDPASDTPPSQVVDTPPALRSE